MKTLGKSENTTTFKNNQDGFGTLEVLMLLVIIVLIVGVGWLVYSDRSKTPTTTSTTAQKTLSLPINNSGPGPNPSQYSGWQSFCSSYGGLCLKYPSSWKLSQATNPPGSSSDGQEIDTFTSPSTNVTVSYKPSALVTGDRRQESVQVVAATATAANGLEVLKLIDNLGGSPSQYAVEDFVTLISAAHALNSTNTPFSVGSTIANIAEPPYHQFTNPARPGEIGQQLLAVTVSNGDPGSNFFASSAAALAWLHSAEVVTAGQILNSATYAQ